MLSSVVGRSECRVGGIVRRSLVLVVFPEKKNRYVAMRRLGGNKKTITATPRQLESLVRLSEALAKMRLASVVERSDVIEAARLVRVALQQVPFLMFAFVLLFDLVCRKKAAIDPVTGTLDMDLITTGRSATR
jgi:DNA replication licensing factor MCM4